MTEIRTKDSILSIATLNADYLVCGQSSGYLELIQVSMEREMTSVGHIHMIQTGYINKVVSIDNADESIDYQGSVDEGGEKVFKLALGSEKGVYTGHFKGP